MIFWTVFLVIWAAICLLTGSLILFFACIAGALLVWILYAWACVEDWFFRWKLRRRSLPR